VQQLGCLYRAQPSDVHCHLTSHKTSGIKQQPHNSMPGNHAHNPPLPSRP
jgi:hypothetical protein